TKPSVFRDMAVPEVLRSGNHKEIDLYRKKQSFINTILKRPDLFIKRELSAEDKKVLVEIITELIKDA
ncbi:MAG TPA: tRNA (guanosine(37)-N1)-methyltransferase TrmD, partial [Petrotogaceae bacterium]|nr:tRNA (guanosine(37)-N1)-methyltransferase TrmD [Petrotogaceae bacterium]